MINQQHELFEKEKGVVEKMDKMVTEFIKLDIVIEKIFEQINEGINEYITNMNDKTNSLVKKYADSFTDACTSINNTTSAFGKTIDEFKIAQGKAVELINAINKTIETIQDKNKE